MLQFCLLLKVFYNHILLQKVGSKGIEKQFLQISNVAGFQTNHETMFNFPKTPSKLKPQEKLQARHWIGGLKSKKDNLTVAPLTLYFLAFTKNPTFDLEKRP